MPPNELISAMLPLLVSDEVGVNFTFKLTLSPGTISTGVAIPLAEKPEPLWLICARVTFAVPEFRTVVTAVAELPTFTLLKLNVAGVAVSVPIAVVVASPARVTFVVGVSGSLLAMATLPE